MSASRTSFAKCPTGLQALRLQPLVEGDLQRLLTSPKPRSKLSESQNCSDKHGPEKNSSGPLPPNREAYSIREVARALAVSEKSIYRLIARGLLRPLKTFRHHRITRKELQRFLDENM